MKLKVTLLFLLSTIYTSSIFAQFNISGTIVDTDTQDFIEFANIVLLKRDSTFVAGASSDSKGLFIFNNLNDGDYILSATFVGYGKKYLPVNNVNKNTSVGKIELKSSDIALDDITVTANAVIQKFDRKIILPSEAQIKASNSGVTLLRNLQLSRIVINPISNSITLPNGDAVQLRINGIEVSTAEIVALHPSDILRIEYHDDPGMRYNNAPAVIDYITRVKESGGNVSLNTGNAPGKMDWGENHFSAKANHKKSEFGVNAYWSYRGIDWTRANEERFIFPDKTLSRTEEGQPTKFKENNLNVSANYSLQDTDNYLFNVRFRNNNRNSPNEFSDRNSVMQTSEDKIPLSISDHSTWRNNTPSLDLYFQKNLKKDQLIIFNVVGTYIDSRSTRSYTEQRDGKTLTDIYSSVVGDKYSLIAEGIYERKLKDGKLSTGLKHNQSFTKNVYSGNVADAVNLKFAETYGFAEYQLHKGKFNYSIGLGIMRTYNSQGNEYNEKYILRPTARISYNINDYTTIRYSAHMSGYSPSLSDLNNVEQNIDSLQIRRGNPNLKTVLYHTHAINAGYHKGIIGIDFFMRYSYDSKPIMEKISFENGKFIRSNINQKAFHRTYMQTTFTIKPWKDYISFSVSPGLNRYISMGEEYTHTYTNWRITNSILLNYKRWSLVSEISNRWINLWGESINRGERIHAVMAGYNAPKWSLGLSMFNPFTKNYTQDNRDLSSLAPSRSKVYTDNLGRTLVINFTMNLSFGRQYNAGNRRLNNDDSDAGIMSGTKQ